MGEDAPAASARSAAEGIHLDFALMNAEGVALIPRCTECRKMWLPMDGERWQAYWVDEGPEEELVFYCPECAEREFNS